MFNIINSVALFRLWIRDKEEGFHGALSTNPKDALIIFILPCKQECHIEGAQLRRFVMLCKSVYISTFSMLYVQLMLGHQLRKMLW
jgi:hypothetical protein